jgi:hypothetical protein
MRGHLCLEPPQYLAGMHFRHGKGAIDEESRITGAGYSVKVCREEGGGTTRSAKGTGAQGVAVLFLRLFCFLWFLPRFLNQSEQHGSETLH